MPRASPAMARACATALVLLACVSLGAVSAQTPSVTPTRTVVAAPRQAVLMLSDPPPCIPLPDEPACDATRAALWNGDPAAWAAFGVPDPAARYEETVILRAQAGDPATIAAIARMTGAPYLKVTRVQFTGDEFVEVTNLGGGPQSLDGWTLRSPMRGAVMPLPAGVVLGPGESCRVYSDPAASLLTDADVRCRIFPRPRELVPAGGTTPQREPLRSPAVSPAAAAWPLDAWPDEGGEVVLYYDALALPGDAVRYSADPARPLPPPHLQLVMQHAAPPPTPIRTPAPATPTRGATR